MRPKSKSCKQVRTVQICCGPSRRVARFVSVSSLQAGNFYLRNGYLERFLVELFQELLSLAQFRPGGIVGSMPNFGLKSRSLFSNGQVLRTGNR